MSSSSSSSAAAAGGGGGGGYSTIVESFTVKIEDEEIKLRTKLYRPEGGEVKMELVLVLVYRHIARIVQSSQDHLAPLASALAAEGAYRALTFDTRGIGRSTGEPSLTGSDEVKDVIAVCRWALNLPRCSNVLLVGCSAGAAIAGSALDQIPQAVGCVAISYPFGLVASYLVGRHFKAMLSSKKQRLFIMGDQDWFTSPSQFKAKVCSAASPKDSQVFKEGKGHCPIQTPSFVTHLVNYILHTFIPTLIK